MAESERKTTLYYKLRDIAKDNIHIKKCKANLSHEQWEQLDSDKIGTEIADATIKILELYLYIPCCHTSGMHDPQHYEERKGICADQLAEAFKRFCKDLGVNPVTRMKPDCCWCTDYPDKRYGEGVRLFDDKNKTEVKEKQDEA